MVFCISRRKLAVERGPEEKRSLSRFSMEAVPARMNLGCGERHMISV